LRFFAPQGRQDSRINVKFGTAEPQPYQISRCWRIFGDFRPKNTKICQKNFQSCKRFCPAGANPSPDFSEMYVLYARNMSTQCSKILWHLVHEWQIYRHKTAIGHFPPNFQSPIAPKLLVGHKRSRWAKKWHGHALSTCQVWWRERKNGWFFVCLFVCFLFVTLTVCVSLDYRRAHCEGYVVAIYRSILMQFSAFLEQETPCRIFQKHLNYITRWRHICFGIRSKFGNFSNFERQRLCARLRPFRRRVEKHSTTAY